jgi:DNA-binding FrmR family transcriptional regulator
MKSRLQIANQKKILARIKRIQGQLNGVAKALEEERECAVILQTVAACRGAINGLVREILEDHIRSHLLDAKNEDEHKHHETAALELIDILRSYLK